MRQIEIRTEQWDHWFNWVFFPQNFRRTLFLDLKGSHTVVGQNKLCIASFMTSCYPWIAFLSGASQPEQTNQIPTGTPKIHATTTGDRYFIFFYIFQKSKYSS